MVWDEQVANSAPEEFLWEKAKTYIMLVSGGTYEVNLGIFATKKPKGQISINGEIVLSTVNTVGYSLPRVSRAKVIGTTLIEFIKVQERSRLSVHIQAENPLDGFLVIKKI